MLVKWVYFLIGFCIVGPRCCVIDASGFEVIKKDSHIFA